MQHVEVVQHEHTRAAGRERAGDAGHGGCPERRAGRLQRLDDAALERLVPVERCRDVAEQDDGIVVALVERRPGEVTGVALRPLGEQRRLPVPGGRDDRDDGRRGGRPQPIHERRPRHGARARRRHPDLRLEEVEGVDDLQRARGRGAHTNGGASVAGEWVTARALSKTRPWHEGAVRGGERGSSRAGGFARPRAQVHPARVTTSRPADARVPPSVQAEVETRDGD